jgi:hypothetical protein
MLLIFSLYSPHLSRTSVPYLFSKEAEEGTSCASERTEYRRDKGAHEDGYGKG